MAEGLTAEQLAAGNQLHGAVRALADCMAEFWPEYPGACQERFDHLQAAIDRFADVGEVPDTTRVGLIKAFLEKHRHEIDPVGYGDVAFIWAGGAPLRVEIGRAEHILAPT